ncbi:glycerophosphodiester phosphodiesterase family protein [Pseudoclavibacter albus]|uniref:glycerophosphodiester phosphodiesterase family protein n=1 Tax=Pseudoclavibacter albus TaxID=272241 RepID=UPI0030B944B8
MHSRSRSGPRASRSSRLAKWKRHVREIHVWTVNEPSEMRRLWQLGVDGIVTDRADLALQVRSSLERRP